MHLALETRGRIASPQKVVDRERRGDRRGVAGRDEATSSLKCQEDFRRASEDHQSSLSAETGGSLTLHLAVPSLLSSLLWPPGFREGQPLESQGPGQKSVLGLAIRKWQSLGVSGGEERIAGKAFQRAPERQQREGAAWPKGRRRVRDLSYFDWKKIAEQFK